MENLPQNNPLDLNFAKKEVPEYEKPMEWENNPEHQRSLLFSFLNVRALETIHRLCQLGGNNFCELLKIYTDFWKKNQDLFKSGNYKDMHQIDAPIYPFNASNHLIAWCKKNNIENIRELWLWVEKKLTLIPDSQKSEIKNLLINHGYAPIDL